MALKTDWTTSRWLLLCPWWCLLIAVISGLANLGVLSAHSTFRDPTKIETFSFMDDYHPQTELSAAVNSSQFRTALLMSVSISIPLLFDAILDCAHPIMHQEERVLWYSKVLLILSHFIPNLCLLTRSPGNFADDTYIAIFYFARTSATGFTLAYTSQVALKYGMKDLSTVCLILVVLSFLSDGMMSLSYFVDPSIGSSLDKMASFLLTCGYGIFFRSIHRWYTVRSSMRGPLSYCELVILVKVITALICNVLFASAAFYFDAFNSRKSSSSCICTYAYIQMSFIIVVITIPGRISRLEVNCATRAMKDRQAFIRYISHEIRTPLNTVFLGLEFVTSALKRIPSRVGDDSIRPVMDTVEDIYNSCEIAMSILNDLLTFDKLDGGKMALELDFVNCCSFINLVSKPFNVNARDKRITFDVNMTELSPDFIENAHIRVDSSKMGQVVRNLISNALKFTPNHGTVTLILSHLKIDNFGDCVNTRLDEDASVILSEENTLGVRDILRLEVRDTGAGISAANQTKLFGQYVQFNANKLQQGNGSGLGLWISKGITELHGGCIGAHSEGEGKGSIFHLELPVTFLTKEEISSATETNVSSVSTPSLVAKTGKSRGHCLSTTASDRDPEVDVGEDMSEDGKGVNEKTVGPSTAGAAPSRRVNSTDQSTAAWIRRDQDMSRTHFKEFRRRSGARNPSEIEYVGDECNDDIESNFDADEMDRSEEDKMEIGSFRIVPGIPSVSSSLSSRSSACKERSTLFGMSELLTQTFAGSVSEPTTLSRKNSIDFLSSVHPFMVTSIPFIQSIPSSRNSVSISSSQFQSRYPSLSNTPRCITPPTGSSDISTPSLTGHSTPYYSSQRVSSAGSATYSDSPMGSSSIRSTSHSCTLKSIQENDVSTNTDDIGVEVNYRINNFSLRPESQCQDERARRSRRRRNPTPSLSPTSPISPVDRNWPGGRLSTDRSRSTSFSAVNQSSKNNFNDAQSWTDSPKNSSCSRIEPLHFLIVDDVLLNRRMVHRLLSTYDFQISEAQDGKDCMSVLEGVESGGGKIDVVLMDNCMPVMTGPQAASALRAKGFKGVIIGVTGHAQSKDIEEFKRCGADAVLAKPLKFEALKDLVRDLLGKEECKL